MRRNVTLAVLIVAAGALSAGIAPAHAAEKLCELHISANDQIQYDKMELTAAADCTEIRVTLTHTGKLPKAAMGHDWVLVKTSDSAAVANAGLAAGIANDYVQPGDPRVIAATKMIGGGESTSVTFPASKLKSGVSYSYICTFPGHSALMHGIFHFG